MFLVLILMFRNSLLVCFVFMDVWIWNVLVDYYEIVIMYLLVFLKRKWWFEFFIDNIGVNIFLLFWFVNWKELVCELKFFYFFY